MAKFSVVVPDGKFCNDDLRCRFLKFRVSEEMIPFCVLTGINLKCEPDSAWIYKAEKCRAESEGEWRENRNNS